MQDLIDFSYVRRNSSEAFNLAVQLEPFSEIILEDNEVYSDLWPGINYNKDSLQEIHKRLALRNQIALANS